MSGYMKRCDCDKDYEDNCHDCCIKMTDPEPRKILLECGQNLESARFDLSSTSEQTFTLGRVIIDTSCLRKPEVKIEFSSIVFYQSSPGNSIGPAIELTFRLRRSCNNEEIVTVLTRVYRKVTQISDNIVEEIISSEPFTISFCECLDFPGCCEYIMEVSGNPANFANIGTAVVDDLSLGAFAQGVDCD
ncbi:DUF4489 domain-containing protein [Wukongibacter baidiensis]|uniref:DUF4489 domain-containing protein n=1 Tax=Wukongibacter baidiensis TaxID=1723361 RepID=UPI003D7FDE73